MAISSPRKLVYIYSETFGNANDHYWVELPTPSDYSGLSATVVDSSRNAQGQVIGQVIISDVAKVELTYKFLTVAQFSAIAKLFEPKFGGSFYVPVSFFDEVAGGYEGDLTKAPTNSSGNNPIRLFYPADRKGVVAHIKLDPTTGVPIGYTDVSINLIDTGFKYGEQA